MIFCKADGAAGYAILARTWQPARRNDRHDSVADHSHARTAKERVVPVARLTFGQHGTSSNLEISQQPGATVAHINISPAFPIAEPLRQHLRAVEGLDLALFVAARDQIMIQMVRGKPTINKVYVKLNKEVNLDLPDTSDAEMLWDSEGVGVQLRQYVVP